MGSDDETIRRRAEFERRMRTANNYPPYGVDRDRFELEAQARQKFSSVFSEDPEVLRTVGQRVEIDHWGCRFVYEPDGRLLAQLLDRDGNRYRDPIEIHSSEDMIAVFEQLPRISKTV